MKETRRIKPRRLASLAGRHAGEDIWVLGSGPSLGFVSPEFFAGRVTICVNFVYRNFPATYCSTTSGHPLRKAVKSRRPWIVPDRQQALPDGKRMTRRPGIRWIAARGVRVDSPEEIMRAPLGPDDLLVGRTSMISAIHAAAILGARAVFVVGLDGGSLDGRWRYEGYRAGFYAHAAEGRLKPRRKATGDRKNVPGWMADVRALRERLLADYGCRVVGFSPFIGLDHEGHVFAPAVRVRSRRRRVRRSFARIDFAGDVVQQPDEVVRPD